MGGKHTKCCCPRCMLAEDNFDRPDSNHPGSKWALVSGTGDIDDNHLVVDGVVATRKCHPAYMEMGSFISTFELVDPVDLDVFRIACGDPNTTAIQVEFRFFGTAGTGTIEVEITGTGDDEAAEGAQAYNWPVGTVYTGKVCYAPGAELNAEVIVDDTPITPQVNSCLATADGEPCYFASDTIDGTVPVGNFSFLLGKFDNWTYEVHWVDLKRCELCSCFCRTDDGEGNYTYSCLPQEVNVTLASVNACTGIDGTYPMYQRLRNDAPEDAPPSTTDWTQKYSWVTNPITCPESTSVKFVLELRCSSTGKVDLGPIPLFEMYCVFWNTAAARGSNFGFDGDDPDTIETASEAVGDNVSYARAKEGSGCDPLSLDFPNLRESTYNSPYGNSCCGGFVDSGGAYEPNSLISVVVTL